jgi:hypothetical protein
MKPITLLFSLVGSILLASPVLAGDRNDIYKHPDMMCRQKIKAKNIPPANIKAEMDKCMDRPNAY